MNEFAAEAAAPQPINTDDAGRPVYAPEDDSDLATMSPVERGMAQGLTGALADPAAYHVERYLDGTVAEFTDANGQPNHEYMRVYADVAGQAAQQLGLSPEIVRSIAKYANDHLRTRVREGKGVHLKDRGCTGWYDDAELDEAKAMAWQSLSQRHGEAEAQKLVQDATASLQRLSPDIADHVFAQIEATGMVAFPMFIETVARAYRAQRARAERRA